MKNRTPFVLAALLALVGCTRTVAYRTPAVSTPDTAYTLSCMRTCDGDDGDRLDCYARCPGVVVTRGDTCEAHDPATSACTVRREGDVTTTVLLIGVSAVLLAALAHDLDGLGSLEGSGVTIGRRGPEPTGGPLGGGASAPAPSLSSPLAP